MAIQAIKSLSGVMGVFQLLNYALASTPQSIHAQWESFWTLVRINTDGKPSLTGWLLSYRYYLASRISVVVAAHFLFWPTLCCMNCRS